MLTNDYSNYFAPEIFEAFRSGFLPNYEDIIKADVFSLGLVLLEMSSLESLN